MLFNSLSFTDFFQFFHTFLIPLLFLLGYVKQIEVVSQIRHIHRVQSIDGERLGFLEEAHTVHCLKSLLGTLPKPFLDLVVDLAVGLELFSCDVQTLN